MASSDKKAWILASLAAKRLAEKLRNPVEAKDIIADYLRDGDLRAQANMMFLSEDVSVSLAWKRRPATTDDDQCVPIAVTDWRRSQRWLGDRADWRWPVSNFSITTARKPLSRLMLRGVELNLDDLRRLQPATFNPRAGIGGNSGKPENRDAFWNAVVTLALEGRLNSGCLSNQRVLIAEVQAIAGNDIFGTTVMNQLASQVWKKFVEPKSS